MNLALKPAAKARTSYAMARFFPLLVLLLMLFAPAHPTHAARPSVLVLQSYHPGLTWTDELTRGVLDAFREKLPEALLWVEYLDAKRNPSPDYLARLAELLRAKLAGQRFDLILACDNVALEFVRTELFPLFPKATVVFCGINGLTPSMLTGFARITGLGETPALAETIRLALHLNPDTREFVVIGGDQISPDDITDRELRATIAQFAPITFTFWNNLDAATLRQRLPDLKEGHVILVHGVLRNEEGILLDYRDKNHFLAQYAKVPIYGFWDFELGSGCLGGVMIEAYAHGHAAGAMAAETLRTGTLPPVVEKTPTVPMFDHRQLVRFGIPRAKLPSHSRILFAPSRFYSIPKQWTWAAALGVALLCAMLALSILALRLRRASQAALERHAAHLELAVAERTRHLREANADLEREVAERIQAENALRKAQAGLTIEVERRTRDLAFEIEQRHQTEALLRDRQAKARALLNAPSESLFLVDEDGVILEINDAAARRIGGNRESLLGMRLADILDEALAATCHAAMATALATHEVQSVHQAGPPRDYDIRISPVRAQDSAEGRLAVFLADVTETQRLTRQILLLDKITSLGRMAAGLAHEIRNPLSGILGYLYALEAMARELPEEAAQTLDTITAKLGTAAGKIEAVIRRVLDFSKPSVPHFQHLDVRDPVTEATSLMATTLRKHGVHLQTELCPEPIWVRGDPTLLEQLVVNLADNAARAARSISTQNPRIRITVEKHATHARISVEDNGPGVPVEDRERIFDPFYTTAVDGTGIGLSIVQRILADHGGGVQVTNSPLGGAAFIVDLPLTPSPGTNHPKP